jgi:glycine cleavage system regulatory protein
MAKKQTRKQKLEVKAKKDTRVLKALSAITSSDKASIASFSSGRTLADEDMLTIRVELRVPVGVAAETGQCDPYDGDNPADATGDFCDLDPKGP